MSTLKLNKDAAGRLKYARSLTGFARTVFCKKHNMSSNTMAAWENNTTYFSEKIAEKISLYLQQEGIKVTPEWIMEGKGSEPVSLNMGDIYKNNFIRFNGVDKEEFLWRATTSFKEFYKDCLAFIMIDDTALPFYKPGDYIGGKIIELENISPLKNEPLIVELEDGSLMLRNVELVSKPNLYNLKTINQHALVGNKIKSIKIKRAAQINWIFKP